MDLPPIYASPGDRNDDVSAAEMAQRHLAVTPLLRGLGGSLTMSNSDDADDFLEEAGRTLQAAIKGLLDLQQQRNSLSDKHLRPLEDNPLRLNMDYATALDVMFAEGKARYIWRLPPPSVKACAMSATTKKLTGQQLWSRFVSCWMLSHHKICCAALCSTAAAMNCASRWMMPEHGKCTAIITKNWPPIASRGLRCCLTRSTPRSMTGCFVKNSGSRKHEQEGVSGLRADVRHINRLRNGEKISEVIKNPDIQVGSLKEQPSEITVTLLTEPDTNTNAEGESAAVDVQLVYLTDDSKLLAADYDQIASTPLPDVLGKTISTTRISTCCRTPSKPCRR